MITRITLRENVDSLFDGAGDTTGVDLEASTVGFLELLAQEVRADFPGVPVHASISGERAPLAETTRLSVDGSVDGREYEDAMEVLREEVGVLYGDWERWLVYLP